MSATPAAAAAPDVASQDSEDSFDRLVEEGEQRLGRSWLGLTATGFLGGLDVGIGVLGLRRGFHRVDLGSQRAVHR